MERSTMLLWEYSLFQWPCSSSQTVSLPEGISPRFGKFMLLSCIFPMGNPLRMGNLQGNMCYFAGFRHLDSSCFGLGNFLDFFASCGASSQQFRPRRHVLEVIQWCCFLAASTIKVKVCASKTWPHCYISQCARAATKVAPMDCFRTGHAAVGGS